MTSLVEVSHYLSIDENRFLNSAQFFGNLKDAFTFALKSVFRMVRFEMGSEIFVDTFVGKFKEIYKYLT